MPRRTILVGVFLCLAALAAAVTPWTLSSVALASAASGRIKEILGLDLNVSGRSTIALLPVPRLTFETIILTAPDRQALVRSGLLRGELRVLPLFTGRLEFSELSLSETVVEVEVDSDGRTPWDAALAGLRERLRTPGGPGHLPRLTLKETDLQVRDRRTGAQTVLRGINLVARWPAAESSLDVAGSMTWRGEPVELTASLRPAALAAGQSSRITGQVSAPLARLTVNGDWAWREAPRVIARTSLETRSLRDFSRWSGVDLPLGSLVQAFALEGEVTVDGTDIAWPSARLTLGGDRLEGALFSRFEGQRRTITGTLAANRLDLTGFVAPLAQARSPSGGWSSEAIDLDRQSGIDLDLRVSASTARMGPLRMEDLAANVSVKPGRYEASIGRVTINKGVVKGRATLASAAKGIEVRGQSSFERVDVAGFLTDVGSPRWIGGLAQGQFTFEGSGDTAAETVQRLHGRAGMTIINGELVGLGLSDLLKRADGRLASAATGWGGRTLFDQAHLNLTMADGTAEIVDGGLASASLRAALHGKVSLDDGVVTAGANVESAAPVEAGSASPFLFGIAGPWENVTIVPVGRPLTQRSGAARPLWPATAFQ